MSKFAKGIKYKNAKGDYKNKLFLNLIITLYQLSKFQTLAGVIFEISSFL